MAEYGRNDPCPCGSGLKYKKCHEGQEFDAGAPVFDLSPIAEPPSRARENLETRVGGFLAVPGRSPGCYDLPAFTGFEREDSTTLDEYARHVVERQQTDEERDRARRLITAISTRIATTATPAELTRRCLQVSFVLLRALEAAGIWAFVVRGSVKFEFDAASRLSPRYFWVRDRADGPGATMGHLWVVAPPFAVVDCTAKMQAWQCGEGQHLPPLILADRVQHVAPQDELYSSSEIRPGIAPPSDQLRRLWSWLGTVRVAVGRTTVTYQADGVQLPPRDENLPGGFPHLTIGGRPVDEFFDSDIRPLFEKPSVE